MMGCMKFAMAIIISPSFLPMSFLSYFYLNAGGPVTIGVSGHAMGQLPDGTLLAVGGAVQGSGRAGGFRPAIRGRHSLVVPEA